MKLKRKKHFILGLTLIALCIILLGAFFTTFSFINGISLPVLKTSVHGSVFGLLVTYLGIRYYLMISEARTNL